MESNTYAVNTQAQRALERTDLLQRVAQPSWLRRVGGFAMQHQLGTRRHCCTQVERLQSDRAHKAAEPAAHLATKVGVREPRQHQPVAAHICACSRL